MLTLSSSRMRLITAQQYPEFGGITRKNKEKLEVLEVAMTSLEQAPQKIRERLKDEDDHINQVEEGSAHSTLLCSLFEATTCEEKREEQENYTQKIIPWINTVADGSGSGDMVQ